MTPLDRFLEIIEEYSEEYDELISMVSEFIDTTEMTQQDRDDIYAQALIFGYNDILDMLADLGWIFPFAAWSNSGSILYYIAMSGNLNLLRGLMDSGFDLSSGFDQDGVVRLDAKSMSVVSHNGDVDMVKSLLDYGWKIYWYPDDLVHLMDYDPMIVIPILESTTPTLLGIEYKVLILRGIREHEYTIPIYEWMRDAGWELPMVSYGDVDSTIDKLFKSNNLGLLRVFLSKTPKGTRWWSGGYNRLNFRTLFTRYPDATELFEEFMRTVETSADRRGIDQLLLVAPDLEAIERTLRLDT